MTIDSKEVWKDISNYEGLYQVSNLGNVKRISPKERPLKPVDIKGYKSVKLVKNGVETRFYIHRLVAGTFIENSNNKRTVNHIDGNKANNNVSNLEWATHQENCKHRDDNNLRVAPKGSAHYLYGTHTRFGKYQEKKTLQYDLQGNFIKEWESIVQAERELHIHNISAASRNLRKTAGGYIWRFKEEI